MSEQLPIELPIVFSRIRATWLSRSLHPEAVIVAAIASLFIALVSIIEWNNHFGLSDLLDSSRQLVYGKGEYWRLWTATLVHSDLKHLLSNLFMFFILGWFLFGYFGSVLFPLSAFIMGGVINALILPTYNPFTTLVGASGIVFYLGGVWLALYFLIQRQYSLLQRILRTGGVALALFMPSEAFDPGVSYRTHFLGLFVGAVVGTVYYFFNQKKFKSAEIREYVVEEPEAPLEITELPRTGLPSDQQ